MKVFLFGLLKQIKMSHLLFESANKNIFSRIGSNLLQFIAFFILLQKIATFGVYS